MDNEIRCIARIDISQNCNYIKNDLKIPLFPKLEHFNCVYQM